MCFSNQIVGVLFGIDLLTVLYKEQLSFEFNLESKQGDRSSTPLSKNYLVLFVSSEYEAYT